MGTVFWARLEAQYVSSSPVSGFYQGHLDGEAEAEAEHS